jgi:hypothetical protein
MLQGAIDLKDVRKMTSAGAKIAIAMNDGIALNLKSPSEQVTTIRWGRRIGGDLDGGDRASDLKAAAKPADSSHAEPTSWLSSVSSLSTHS